MSTVYREIPLYSILPRRHGKRFIRSVNVFSMKSNFSTNSRKLSTVS